MEKRRGTSSILNTVMFEPCRLFGAVCAAWFVLNVQSHPYYYPCPWLIKGQKLFIKHYVIFWTLVCTRSGKSRFYKLYIFLSFATTLLKTCMWLVHWEVFRSKCSFEKSSAYCKNFLAICFTVMWKVINSNGKEEEDSYFFCIF